MKIMTIAESGAVKIELLFSWWSWIIGISANKMPIFDYKVAFVAFHIPFVTLIVEVKL